MLSVYLFAAILGGGLLLIAMLGGEGGDGDVADAGADLDAGGEVSGWTHVLSFRTAAYALAGFGLTGAALSWLDVAATPTLVTAAATGLAGGALAGWFFGLLRRSEGGFAETSDQYIGGVGKTEVRIPRRGRGRVELVHRGRAFTLPATSAAGEIGRHERVIILDVVDGIAVVDRAPEELTL